MCKCMSVCVCACVCVVQLVQRTPQELFEIVSIIGSVSLQSAVGYIGSQPSDHYFRSVCLSVCLFICLFVQSFSQLSLIRFRSN